MMLNIQRLLSIIWILLIVALLFHASVVQCYPSFVKRGNKTVIQITDDVLQMIKFLHKERRKVLQSQCNNISWHSHLTEKQMTNMIINRHHRVLLCNIPAVTPPNWVTLMGSLNDMNGTRKYTWQDDDIMRFMQGEHLTLKDMPISERQKVMTDEYIRLIFVQHPMDRMLKNYRKFLQTRQDLFPLDPKSGSLYLELEPFKQEKRFKKFIEIFIEYAMETIKMEPILETIENLCNPCVMNYDVIGKLETIFTDSALALHLIGINNFTFYPLSKKFTTRTFLKSYYTKIGIYQLRKFHQIYHADFVLFNYTIVEVLGPKYQLNMENVGFE